MNLQDIIEPLGRAMEGSFETLLVPISNMFNWLVIFGGFIGLGIWLKLQNDYTKKAKAEGTRV